MSAADRFVASRQRARLRRLGLLPRPRYRPRVRVMEPRTPEEQAAYELRHAPRENCLHMFYPSGDGRCLICHRCWGFEVIAP